MHFASAPNPHRRNQSRLTRGHETVERVLTALGELLREKSFDEISMAELAARAGCAVTSIDVVTEILIPRALYSTIGPPRATRQQNRHRQELLAKQRSGK